jgi:Zn-dependent peptidase ImmA (M78 family)
MKVRTSYIRSKVIEILRDNKIVAAPINVQKISTKFGIQIHPYTEEGNLSGFLYQDEKMKLIGVNKQHHKNRQRFTIAHELGHFVLHSQETTYLDKPSFFGRNNEISSAGTEIKEVEANSFAAELLMPKHFIEMDWEVFDTSIFNSIEDVVDWFAKRYQVSTHAMTLRLNNLGYLREI